MIIFLCIFLLIFYIYDCFVLVLLKFLYECLNLLGEVGYDCDGWSSVRGGFGGLGGGIGWGWVVVFDRVGERGGWEWGDICECLWVGDIMWLMEFWW